ncbi:Uncharacterised protein [Streptococcus sp. NCTC 11567]|nr:MULTISPECIES: hypothetical protein [Streptococcus]SUN64822.1 Uncharacterised protein [Streptococcus dysgalactiae subsp. equisimilis]VUC95789.1 Uncharacterised protein [Streptococcus sp. NCTC 11567]
MVKKVFLSLGCYLLIAFGISLTIKAAIGVSSFNALNVALSEWSHLEVGTVTGCLNSFFLVVSYLLDDKKSKKEYSLIILSVCCLSYQSFCLWDVTLFEGNILWGKTLPFSRRDLSSRIRHRENTLLWSVNFSNRKMLSAIGIQAAKAIFLF